MNVVQSTLRNHPWYRLRCVPAWYGWTECIPRYLDRELEIVLQQCYGHLSEREISGMRMNVWWPTVMLRHLRN
jgi:hypothetical protein